MNCGLKFDFNYFGKKLIKKETNFNNPLIYVWIFKAVYLSHFRQNSWKISPQNDVLDI